MSLKSNLVFIIFLAFGLTSCVSNKKYTSMKEGLETNLASSKKQLEKRGEELKSYMKQVSERDERITNCEGSLKTVQNTLNLRHEQINDLKEQLADTRSQRDRQVTQIGDLAVLSQSANENIKETLSQLEKKDRYIQLLQAAKSKADSINLALAINLKGVLKEGIDDRDIEIKVDKTVVFINLSDKMLYQSGSANLTPRAHEVLEKIARIVESRTEFDVMVEGYTDKIGRAHV